MTKNLSPLFQVFFCDFLNPISPTESQYIIDAGIVLKKYSKGYKVFDIGKRAEIQIKYKRKRSILYRDKSHMLMLPSFFDMHFHWVQDDVRDKPKTSLLKWLENYTWPYEEKFKNQSFSKGKAKEFSKKLLQNGTLGGACYSSIHSHSVRHAQKEFIGKYIIGNVLMDMNSPQYLLQKTKDALKIVSVLSNKYKKNYAFTPRFALSTSPDLMKLGMKLIKKNKCFIQTHLSENTFEIQTILNIYKKIEGFKDIKSYTEIYLRCGLLTDKSIFGHGIHLSKKELEILAQSKSSIAHCPTSNAPISQKGLGSGLFNFKLVEKYQIKWALGSDIGAGPFLSMFDVMESFVKQNQKKKIKEATYLKALYHATLAGASILKIDKEFGNLSKDKYANFLFIKLNTKDKSKKAEELLKNLITITHKNRKTRNNMVEETYYKGELSFKKN